MTPFPALGENGKNNSPHTADTVPGDSGDPLLNIRGELLGIVTERGLPLFDILGLSSCVAVRPNPETIERLIEKDRHRDVAKGKKDR